MNGLNEKTPESHECKRQLSSLNQVEQDFPVRQKSNASEGCKSAVIVKRKVVRLTKQARNHRSDSKPNDSEMPADVSVKQPNKGLSGYWIKAKVRPQHSSTKKRDGVAISTLAVHVLYTKGKRFILFLREILNLSNRRFPSCLSPLFQNECKCKALHVEISFIHM